MTFASKPPELPKWVKRRHRAFRRLCAFFGQFVPRKERYKIYSWFSRYWLFRWFCWHVFAWRVIYFGRIVAVKFSDKARNKVAETDIRQILSDNEIKTSGEYYAETRLSGDGQNLATP